MLVEKLENPMHAKLSALIIGLLFCSMATARAFAQAEAQKTAYSESESYAPRQFAAKYKTKKRKKKESESSKQTSLNSGPLTIAVSVLDRDGNAVTDLTESEIKIYVDEIETKATAPQKQTDPVNLILLVDTSPSAGTSEKHIRLTAAAIVKGLDPRSSVTVVGFNKDTKIHLKESVDRKKIDKVIKDLDTGDGTSFYEALRFVSEKVLPTAKAPSVVIVLTDGVDTTSILGYEESLLHAEMGNTPIYSVYFDTFDSILNLNKNLGASGIRRIPLPQGFPMPSGPSPESYALGKMYLNDLALLSGGRVLESYEFDTGNTVNIGDELSNRYFVTIDGITGVAGVRKSIKIRINRPGLTVLAKGSYLFTEGDPSQ